MSSGPRRRKSRPPRPDRANKRPDATAEDDDNWRKELSPSQRSRQLVIRIGVGILLIAFCMTSGIMCVNLNQGAEMEARQRAAEGERLDPVDQEIERWRRELKEHPGDATAMANLAYFLIQKGATTLDKAKAKPMLDEAETQLNAALKVDPNYPFGLLQMARLRMTQDKPEEAKTAFETALKAATAPIDPNDKDKASKEQNAIATRFEAHMGLAQVASSQKKLDDAVKHLTEAITVAPGRYEAYMARANMYSQQGQKELARKDLDTVMKIAQAMPESEMKFRLAMAIQAQLYALDPEAFMSTATPTPQVDFATASPTPAPAGTGTPAASPTPAATSTPVPFPTP